MIQIRTFTLKPTEVTRKWHLLDAKGEILGRLSVKAASVLRGKHKATFTPHVDCGDGVIVVNAEKVRVTGTKLDHKMYQRYSGYPGGLHKESMRRLLERRPTEVVRRAVVGMLPKNTLGRQAARRLRVYVGSNHPHVGQLKATEGKKST